MGCRVSSEASANRRIDRDIIKDKTVERKTIKLLLLGSGECGKSTILKQMQILHTRGMRKQDVLPYKSIIATNILNALYGICQGVRRFNITFEDPVLQDLTKELSEKIDSFELNVPLPEFLYANVKRLLADQETIRLILDRRYELFMDDSAAYFLENIDRFQSHDYVPTEQDVLRARSATSGIVEVSFKFQGAIFRVFDVGGQKSERRKWIHVFDNVTALIFVVAISEYDQTLREDPSTNRMIDSMTLFGSICRLEHFIRTDIILFLNKTDLFAQKIKQTSIKVAFPKYQGDQDYKSSIKYVGEQLLGQNISPEKVIRTHETCATDTKQVKTVIDGVVDMLVHKHQGAIS